jgi:hypothetical protein
MNPLDRRAARRVHRTIPDRSGRRFAFAAAAAASQKGTTLPHRTIYKCAWIYKIYAGRHRFTLHQASRIPFRLPERISQGYKIKLRPKNLTARMRF